MGSERPRAAIYARLSRHRGDERSASTQRQEEACRTLATERGYEVVALEIDDDVSAYSGKRRPGYDRLIEAIDAGAVDVVLAWAPDRLHRSPAELEDFIDLLDRTGAEVATVQAGRVDLSTPAGRMMARQLGIVARYESEHRSERTRAAHAQLAAEGRWSGGRRPYGYRPIEGTGRMEIVPEEAAVIEEAIARVLAGEKVGAVCGDLNRRGVPTVTGAQWRTPTLRSIISSPTIAGYRVVDGGRSTVGAWPAIVPLDQIEAVKIVLERGPKRGRIPRVALLTGGRLRCGKCRGAMTTFRRGSGKRAYRCMGCFTTVTADPLEEIVEAAIVSVLTDARVPDVESVPIDTSLIVELEGDLEALAADHGAGIISRAEWMAAREGITARIEEARKEAAHALGSSASIADLAGMPDAGDRYRMLPLDRRQAVLDALVEEVIVNRTEQRGPRFDPNRLDIRWKA